MLRLGLLPRPESVFVGSVLCLQPSVAVRLALGEHDEHPYEGQDGTQVTAAVTGEQSRPCCRLVACGAWLGR